jgi:hypothetical protein
MIDPKILQGVGELDQLAAAIAEDDPQAIEKAQTLLRRVVDSGDPYLIEALIEAIRVLADEAISAKRKGEA